MYYFGLAATGTAPDPNNSMRGVLVVNHENIVEQYLHANGPTTLPSGARPEAEVLKEMECHGVSVGRSDARRQRRLELCPGLDAQPPHHADDADGVQRPGARQRGAEDALLARRHAGRGTINNCANGYTPWGTNLTCEENWAGYFRRDTGDNARAAAPRRRSTSRSRAMA